MKFHRYADVFPLLDPDHLTELAEDIRANGLREPIWLLDGQILDGRNRFLACQKAKVKPRYREFSGDDPLAFVISHNIHRRHLTDAQRSYAAAKIATLRHGQQKDDPPNGGSQLSQQEAAEALNTSVRSVQRAKKVIEQGSAALNKAFQSGEVSLSKAASVVDLPKSEQLKAATAEPDFKIEDYDPAADDAALALAEKEYGAAIDTIVGSDHRFEAFNAEIKRLTGELAVVTRSRDHYQNQAGEAVRMLKAEQRKVAALEKKLKRLDGEDAPDRPAVGMQ